MMGLDADDVGWTLEGFLDEARRRPIRVPIRRFPFRVGRRADLELCLPSAGVSALHAELEHTAAGLVVRDLDSRNGTFVNRARVDAGGTVVHDGDVLHFARLELRLQAHPLVALDEATASTTIDSVGLPKAFFSNARAFRQMLEDRDVRVLYQPLVALDSRQTVAWEALGRVSVEGLPPRPDALFRIAADLDREVEFSSLLREVAVSGAAQLPGPRPTLFVNTRPAETRDLGMLDGLERLARAWPGIDLVLEVHETAITDVARMRDFSRRLADMGVALAYDDFGAGQARLLELADAPPKYLKFDRSMCAGLHVASAQRRHLLSTLIEIAREFDVVTVAEGVETEEEADACRDIGFQLAQGFLFGRPAPAPGAGPEPRSTRFTPR